MNTKFANRGRRFVFTDLNGKEIIYDIPEKMTHKNYDVI